MDTIATPLVQNNGNPVWDYQCATQIPNYYLDSEVRGYGERGDLLLGVRSKEGGLFLVLHLRWDDVLVW